MMSWLLQPEVQEAVSKFGFGILAFGLLVFVLIRVLRHQDKIVDTSAKERESWLETLKIEREQFVTVLSEITKNLEVHSSRAKEFHRQIRDAHTFQREEHIKILDSMNEMCVHIKEGNGDVKSAIEQMRLVSEQRSGENKLLLDTLQAMNENCKQHGLMLARMNGKTHKD